MYFCFPLFMSLFFVIIYVFIDIYL
jgi:hypothetical protein